jgi:hypothetical protein
MRQRAPEGALFRFGGDGIAKAKPAHLCRIENWLGNSWGAHCTGGLLDEGDDLLVASTG